MVRLFGGIRRTRTPKIKKKSLRRSTSPQKERPKEKEKSKEKEKPKEKEKLKEKETSSRNLLQKSSIGAPLLRKELSKTLLSSPPSIHSPPLSVSVNSKNLQHSKSSSPQSSPSPTFQSFSSIPFPPVSPSSPTSPTLLRATRNSFKNLNINTNEIPPDYSIPLAPTTYSPFRVAPRDIFGNIVAPNAENIIVGEKQQNSKPKTPPLLNPHNETLLKLLGILNYKF